MKTGSGIKFADWAVIILAAILFFKTAEVLSYFSPEMLNTLIGFDVSWIYGIVTAFFVEGVAIAYHFHPGARNYGPAVSVKWILIAISGVCQVFDGRIVTGTLADMTEAQKLFFQFGVPLLPLFVLVLLFFVGEIPTDPHVRSKHWKGIKNLLPDPKRIWEGDPEEYSEFSEELVGQPVKPKPANGEKHDTVNPMKAERR